MIMAAACGSHSPTCVHAHHGMLPDVSTTVTVLHEHSFTCIKHSNGYPLYTRIIESVGIECQVGWHQSQVGAWCAIGDSSPRGANLISQHRITAACFSLFLSDLLQQDFH